MLSVKGWRILQFPGKMGKFLLIPFTRKCKKESVDKNKQFVLFLTRKVYLSASKQSGSIKDNL